MNGEPFYTPGERKNPVLAASPGRKEGHGEDSHNNGVFLHVFPPGKGGDQRPGQANLVSTFNNTDLQGIPLVSTYREETKRNGVTS